MELICFALFGVCFDMMSLSMIQAESLFLCSTDKVVQRETPRTIADARNVFWASTYSHFLARVPLAFDRRYDEAFRSDLCSLLLLDSRQLAVHRQL